MRTFLVVLSLAILVGLAQPALGLPLDLSISFTLDHVSGSNTCLDGAEVTLFATFADGTAYTDDFFPSTGGFPTAASASHTLTIENAPTIAACNGGVGYDGMFTENSGGLNYRMEPPGSFLDGPLDTDNDPEFVMPDVAVFTSFILLTNTQTLTPAVGDPVSTGNFGSGIDAGNSFLDLDGTGYTVDTSAPAPVISPSGGPTDGSGSTLTVTGSGDATGTIMGTGISCTSTTGVASGDCSEDYADGTMVTLTAAAATGMFVTFSGATCTTTNPCTFTINSDVTVDAEFSLPPPTGTINIVKAAIPANNNPFGFTSTIPGGAAFTLRDPSDATKTFMSVAVGSYDVTETVPAGWTLDAIGCVGDIGGSVVDLPNKKVTIDLDPGAVITCTFTNTLNDPVNVLQDCWTTNLTLDSDPELELYTFATTDPIDFIWKHKILETCSAYLASIWVFECIAGKPLPGPIVQVFHDIDLGQQDPMPGVPEPLFTFTAPPGSIPPGRYDWAMITECDDTNGRIAGSPVPDNDIDDSCGVNVGILPTFPGSVMLGPEPMELFDVDPGGSPPGRGPGEEGTTRPWCFDVTGVL